MLPLGAVATFEIILTICPERNLALKKNHVSAPGGSSLSIHFAFSPGAEGCFEKISYFRPWRKLTFTSFLASNKTTRAASNRKQLLFIFVLFRKDAKHCVSTRQYYYSTTFFMAVMAARSSAPQISIE